ncbi:MAG: hypothetical protein QXG39_00270 [Candidatus Aenigmatarchaeota archaeon]
MATILKKNEWLMKLFEGKDELPLIELKKRLKYSHYSMSEDKIIKNWERDGLIAIEGEIVKLIPQINWKMVLPPSKLVEFVNVCKSEDKNPEEVISLLIDTWLKKKKGG